MTDNSAFLFAGQGSQYVGMGKDLYDNFPECRRLFEQADAALGLELSRLCFEGPADQLKATSVSQPAIVTVSVAAFTAFNHKHEVKARYAAGLSLGEYSALIALRSLPFSAGIKLVHKRGQLMEAAAKKYPGKMAAIIDLPKEMVLEICHKAGGVEIANLNAPGQVVISGFVEAVDKAKEMCLNEGARRSVDLEVSGGFHSPLMFEASGELRKLLEIPLLPPRLPVVSNYTAKPQIRPEEIRQNLVYQLYSMVRWEDSMRFILGHGITRFYEFGPGKVLKGLMRKIEPKAEVIPIEKVEDLERDAPRGTPPGTAQGGTCPDPERPRTCF